MLLRILLLSPLVLLFLAGINEALTSPFQWSSNRSWSSLHVQDWVASLSPFIVALPAVLSAILGLVRVFRLTQERFRLHVAPLCFGLAFVLAFAFLEWIQATRSNPYVAFSYGSLFGTKVHASLSLIATLGIVIVFGGLMSAGASVYRYGIAPIGTGKFERRLDEPDAVGHLIASMHRERIDE